MSDEPNNRTAYLFDPKSPLVFRTGRPFDQAGDPVSLDFPLPSTLAGACRTAIGDAKKVNFAKDGEKLKEIKVHGPLAAQITEDGKAKPLFPKPADAVYMRKDGRKEDEIKTEVLQLKPEDINEDANETDTWSDLPKGLLPVYPEKELSGKPYRKGANWWTKENLVAWLLDNGELKIAPEKLGWSGPQQEVRTHVQLESKTLAAAPSQLFQTNNLSFSPKRLTREEDKEGSKHEGWTKEQYGLLAHLPKDNLKDMPELFRRIGGEGRIARVERQEDGWPQIDGTLRTELKQSKFIRLILATPALFKHGWRPGWLEEDMNGYPPGFSQDDQYTIRLQLKAFITPRWQPVSGWDLVRNPQSGEKQGKGGPGAARAVRRMVPAGAVYWFEVEKGQDQLHKLWLQPISDEDQDQKDGYGLVLPGIWHRKS